MTNDAGRPSLTSNQAHSRRQFLLAGGTGAVALGAAGAVGWAAGVTRGATPVTASGGSVATAVDPTPTGSQRGIVTPPQTYTTISGWTIKPGQGLAELRAMLTLWWQDLNDLCAGLSPVADSEPELATLDSQLTATIGFGPRLFAAIGRDTDRPSWCAPLPAFSIDRLQPAWSGGDVMLQLCGNDQLVLHHALRVAQRTAADQLSLAWAQSGFRDTREHTTGRNLFGQVDGTVNPKATAEFAAAIWHGADAPAWLRGGTSIVVRRIAMDLDTWDRVGRGLRERSIGRSLDNGRPLTGVHEQDTPDWNARDAAGNLIIHEHAHMRRAHAPNTSTQILRRPYNFESLHNLSDPHRSGLIFISYQRDAVQQFVPIQQSLSDNDLLNEWTTPIGSAVFAIPGVQPGSAFPGAALFT